MPKTRTEFAIFAQLLKDKILNSKYVKRHSY